MAASVCRGYTQRGQRCANSTLDSSRWCGRCAGVLTSSPASHPLSGPAGPGPDPLGGVRDWLRLDPSSRAATACSEGAAPEILEVLAGDEVEGVAVLAAGNTSTPPEVIAAAAVAGSPQVSVAALRNPSSPPAVLEGALLGPISRPASGFTTGALAAAANPSCPPATLFALVDGPDVVREPLMRAAQNPALFNDPRATFAYVVDRGEPHVRDFRRSVGRNPGCPPEILARFAGDPSDYVRRAVAANRQTPIEIVEALADDESTWVRRAVASNPGVGVGYLRDLAADPVAVVRRGVAANESTPPDMLMVLAADPVPGVRERVLLHPACPPAARATAGLFVD